MNNNEFLFEGCVDSIEQADYYANLGIDRLELCSNLAVGGLIPDYDLVKHCINKLKIDCVVMLRLRDDFRFLPEDLFIFQKHIQEYRNIGVNKFIFGFVVHGKIDVLGCKQIIDLLDGCQYGFHMAIDTIKNYDIAINTLINLKFSWILTGGGNQLPAIENIDEIKKFIILYGNKINFLIGRKVDKNNWSTIAKKTGANWFHGRNIK